MMGRRLGLIAGLAGFIALAGCARAMTDPSRATRPYPVALHVPSSVDIQVFRRGTSITVVNATPVTYRNASMWINQRFVRPIARLDAGARRTYSLWDFRDDRGDVFNAGGPFRTVDPTPVRLVQIEIDDTTPLVGCVTIRAEEAE